MNLRDEVRVLREVATDMKGLAVSSSSERCTPFSTESRGAAHTSR